MSDRSPDRWLLSLYALATLVAIGCLFWVGAQVPPTVLFALYPVGLVLGATLARVEFDLIHRRDVRRPAAEAAHA